MDKQNLYLQIKSRNIKQRARSTTNRTIIRWPADKRGNLPAAWLGGATTCLLCRELVTSRLHLTALLLSSVHWGCAIRVICWSTTRRVP